MNIFCAGLKNKPPIETKERNIWRGRREVKIHSRNKRRRRRRGNFKTSEGTQFDCACVRTHISIFDVCYCTYTYIHTYIYWATLCRSKCTLMCQSSCKNRMTISVKHYYYLNHIFLQSWPIILLFSQHTSIEWREKGRIGINLHKLRSIRHHIKEKMQK